MNDMAMTNSILENENDSRDVTDTSNYRTSYNYGNSSYNNNNASKNRNMNKKQKQINSRQPNAITIVSEINSRYNALTNTKPNIPTLPAYNLNPNSGVTNNLEQKTNKSNKPVKITSRMVFLKIGSVDTKNERYDAEAYVECWWEDEQIYKLLTFPDLSKNIHNPVAMEALAKQAADLQLNVTNNLVHLKNIINNINILEYDTNLFWSPQLYIENALGELKEEIRHKLEIVEKEGSNILSDANFDPKTGHYKTLVNNLTVRVWEMRKIRGVFYERLELYDFPMDLQELSITLTSKHNKNDLEIVENTKESSSINTDNFLDQQEWDLFDSVKTSTKVIYDKWRKYERTGFTMSCFIARKPGYYLYNAYMLVMLITILGFVSFAFDTGAPQFRCQICGLLILTSVNFRVIVTQKLPCVPYLTSLDKYAIGNLFFLIMFCVWHSLIGSNLISSDITIRKKIDRYVLLGSIILLILFNCIYLVWFVIMYRSIRKFEAECHEKSKNEIKKNDEEGDKKVFASNETSFSNQATKRQVSFNNNVVKRSAQNSKTVENYEYELVERNDPSFMLLSA